MTDIVCSKLLRIEMLHMVQMLANHIRVTFIAPKTEICKAEGERMQGLFVVSHHMGLDISTASNLLAHQADPILFGMATIFAWCTNCNVFKFFDWRDIHSWHAMRALVYWLNGMESHDWPFCIDLLLLLLFLALRYFICLGFFFTLRL